MMFDNIPGIESQTRRLPIYLLLDTSGSMMGNNIEAVNEGVKLLTSQLKKDPMALETAYLSVITFDSDARQLIPLTAINDFIPPKIEARGATSLGAALKVLNEALDREVRGNSPEVKGDYKPLVFLMTDGRPTDNWEPAMAALRNRPKQKVATIIALGCGSPAQVDGEILKKIGNVVLMMDNVSPDQIAKFFQWVSQSVSTASKSAVMTGPSQDTGETGAVLSNPPEGIRILI
jgi:uncharacterized protein YegL